MKKYSSIIVKAPHNELIQILEKLRNVSSNDYKFEEGFANDYAVNIFRKPEEVACFRALYDGAYNSTIWLCITDDELKVTNIVPDTITRLSITQYNMIMNAFFMDFLSKVIDASNVVYIDGENLEMKEMISPDAYKKLMDWVGLCNKDNPLSHVNDEERWFDFLIAINNNNDDLSPKDLVRWLQEDYGWSYSYNPERFDEISYAYEYGLSLLKYYNK